MSSRYSKWGYVQKVIYVGMFGDPRTVVLAWHGLLPLQKSCNNVGLELASSKRFVNIFAAGGERIWHFSWCMSLMLHYVTALVTPAFKSKPLGLTSDAGTGGP